MEAGTGYQGCLPSCKLQIHSRRSLSGGLAKWKFVDCACKICDLKIVHLCYAISKLAAQSQDSENAQRNLEIAQILRLHGTYACVVCMASVFFLLFWALVHPRTNKYHPFYLDFMHVILCSRHFFVL